MKMTLGAAVLSAIAATSAGAYAQQQIIVPAQQPVIVTTEHPEQRRVIVTQPTTTTTTTIVTQPGTQPVVMAPAQVVTTTPVTYARIYAPQGVVQINTATPMAAPFAPAPHGTLIETSADRRLIKVVDGYHVIYEVDGKQRASYALFTDGLDDVRMWSRGYDALWPLEVGKHIQVNADSAQGVRAIDFRVARTEIITVPAGTFYTYVVERRDRSVTDNSVNLATFWYAPSVGAVVKFDERLGRAGKPTPAFEATAIRLPMAPPGAVIVAAARRVDTIENQTMYCAQRGTTVRLSDGRLMTLDCPAYVQADRGAYENWLILN